MFFSSIKPSLKILYKITKQKVLHFYKFIGMLMLACVHAEKQNGAKKTPKERMLINEKNRKRDFPGTGTGSDAFCLHDSNASE